MSFNPNAPAFNPNARAFVPGKPKDPVTLDTEPKTVSLDTAPKTVSLDTAPKTVSLDTAPKTVSLDTAPKTVSLDTAPKTVSLDTAPKTVSLDTAPKTVSLDTAPKTVSLDTAPKTVSLDTAPKTVSLDAKTPSGSNTPARSASPPPAPQPTRKEEAKAKKAAAKASAASTESTKTEAEQAADEETLKDLYGVGNEKPHLNVVFIGHVDAGKSTLGGQILTLTGMVDRRTLERFEKEARDVGRDSWYLSYALDATPQERSQGKTIEVGRGFFETDKRRYSVLDAPGHKNYVPSMISGAAQADVAVLVISARKGEFETGFERGGQTREHAILVKTAGVNKLCVVVNKMDEPTVQWDKARFDEIVEKLNPFLKGIGFDIKKDVIYIPVSGQSGENIKDPVNPANANWVTSPTLLGFLDNMEMTDRKLGAPFKMPIAEKFGDLGTMVVGKIEAGAVRRGDQLLLMPNKTNVSVSAIFNETDDEIPSAVSGDNIRIRLRGVEEDDVSVGFVLSSSSHPVHAVTRFEAQLVVLEHRNIITAGYSAVMHVHMLSEEVRLDALLHYYDKKTGKRSRRPPAFAKKGQKILALLETADPVCVERFEEYPQLGRFTLRDEGRTVAIGKVWRLIESDRDLPDVARLSIAE